MYQISLTNNSNTTLGFVGGNQIIPPGGRWQSGDLGDITLTVPTRGPLSFHDIGSTHIGGDSGETWGVLIAYQGEEIVGRYEGGGRLTVEINGYYQAVLSGLDLRQVQLSAFQIPGATLAAAEGDGAAEPAEPSA